MSQILLREVNKYNNSIGYFSKNKKLSYSSTDIYIASSDKNKPIILNFEECRSATALYGCNEKIKTIYLNIIMQAIETDMPFTIVNTLFNPLELEEAIRYKLSTTTYKYSIYSIDKEDLENENINLLTKEASMIVNYHNYNCQEHEKGLLRASLSRSFASYFQPVNQNDTKKTKIAYALMIMACDESDVFFHPQFISMGRSIGIYNFFSNNELDLSKLANSSASILLNDSQNISKYKDTLDVFQFKQVNEIDYNKELKEQIKEQMNTNYKNKLNENESYIVRNNSDVTRLIEIKKFY